MSYVICCGDEGVQINVGTRLGVVGAGLQLDGFSEIVAALKKLFPEELRIAANDENDWVKAKLNLSSWDQVNASMQQHVQVLADKEGLLYAGNIPFADPQELAHGIKAHMVRPKKVHIATKVTFTCAGGESKFHLGQNPISVEWLHLVDKKLAKQIIDTQVKFYELIAKQPLDIDIEMAGELGEEIANRNQAILAELGYIAHG